MISPSTTPAVLAAFAACSIGIGSSFAAPPIDQAGEHHLLIPAAARVAGLGGSTWRTEATLDNPGDEAATVHLYLLERNRDNTDTPGTTVVIEAGASLYLADLIADIFERDDVAGAIFIGADQPILVESRTYSSGAAGTFGQRIPGLQIRPPGVSGGDPIFASASPAVSEPSWVIEGRHPWQP